MFHGSNMNSLIEKTAHFDKDERYMATNDIMKALQQDINIDDHTEGLICTAVLKQLDDRSNDVQGVAVKCLSVLVKTVGETQISQISIRLCDLVLNGSDALRDVYSIGLKTLMSSVPPSMGELLVGTLTSRLLVGTQHANDDIKRECLDSLTDLLKRFGHLMKADHEAVLAEATPHLTNPKAPIQKRAVVCLSALAATLSDANLFSLIDQLLANISSITSSAKLTSTDEKNLRVFIQTVGRITRVAGHRLGEHLPQVVPLLLKCLGDFDDESMQTDAGNELRENCFPGFESFVLRCPREVGRHVTPILKSSLEFMKFDPNYCYDDDEEEDEADEDEEEDEYDEEYDDAGGSDDDDSSWKVRKAALRVIEAIIRQRDEVVKDEAVYKELCDELLGRFKEREESVQLEVFSCVTQLLEESVRSPQDGGNRDDAPPSLTRSVSGSGPGADVGPHVPLASSTPVPSAAICAYLETKLPFFLRTAKKMLSVKGGGGASQKVKSALILLLRRLVAVLQGSMSTTHMDVLMTTLLESLHAERTQSLKLECLFLLMDMFRLQPPASMQQYIPRVLPEIFLAARDDWYKLVAASLKLLGILIGTARPLGNGSSADDSMEIEGEESMMFDLSPHFQDIYDTVHPRLEAMDVDHEIKEASIACAGQLLGVLGDSFPPSLVLNLVHLLLKRVENEITRIAALKAIAFIASSPVVPGGEISSVLSAGAVQAITPFLRQQSRLLKQTTLQTLSAIMTIQRNLQYRGVDSASEAALLSTETTCSVLKELSQLLLVSDMNITDLGLQVIIQMIQSCQKQVEAESSIQSTLTQDVLPKAIDLAISPVLQGGAQASLIDLLCLFFLIPQLQVSFNDLKQSLTSFVVRGQSAGQEEGATGGKGEYVPHPLQSVSTLAKVVAGICQRSPYESRRQTITDLLDELDAPNATSGGAVEARKHLALLCVGRMGEGLDLTGESEAPLADRLKAAIKVCFAEGTEDVRAATAFALGRLAVGSMAIFLPIVLEACAVTGGGPPGGDNKHQYLLLVALKETIVVHVTSPSSSALSFTPYLDTVLPGLLALARTSPEEGVRNMVAECLGALASTSTHTEKIVSLLQETAHAEQNNKLLLWTVATSMRFFFSRVSLDTIEAQIDAQPFLLLLQDEDLDVKRAALLMINAAVHYTPSLVLPHLDTLVLPHILVLLSYKQKREVQMGPFKHIVDDALPLRKGALTCYETMLYVLPDAIQPTDLLEHLTKLLVDNLNETNLQCHQILCKLCTVAPSAMLCALEGFINPLQQVITRYEKMDQGSGEGGPEKARALEQVRSCVRVIASINKLEHLEVVQQWGGFVSRLQRGAGPVAALLAEHEGGQGGLREK